MRFNILGVTTPLFPNIALPLSTHHLTFIGHPFLVFKKNSFFTQANSSNHATNATPESPVIHYFF